MSHKKEENKISCDNSHKPNYQNIQFGPVISLQKRFDEQVIIQSEAKVKYSCRCNKQEIQCTCDQGFILIEYKAKVKVIDNLHIVIED